MNNTRKEFIIENLSTHSQSLQIFLTDEHYRALQDDKRFNPEYSNATWNEIARKDLFNLISNRLPSDAVYRSYADFCRMIRTLKKLPKTLSIEDTLNHLRHFLNSKDKYFSVMVIDEDYDFRGNLVSNDQYDIVELMRPESLIIMVREEPFYKHFTTNVNGKTITRYSKQGVHRSFRYLTPAEYLEEHGYEVHASMHTFDTSTPIQFRQNQENMEYFSRSNFDFDIPRMCKDTTIDMYARLSEDRNIDIHTKEKTEWSRLTQESYVSKTGWTKEEYIKQTKLLKAYRDFIAEHPEIEDLFDDIDTGKCPCCHQKTRIKLDMYCQHCGHQFTAKDIRNTPHADACQGVSFDAPMVDWLSRTSIEIERLTDDDFDEYHN